MRATDPLLAEFSRRVRAHAGGPTDARDADLSLAEDELRAQHDELAAAAAYLDEERAKYVALFDEAPDAYVVTDASGVIREANAAAGTLLGMAPASLRQKLLIAFMARQDTRAFRAHLHALHARAGDAAPLVVRVRSRTGGVVRVSASVRAMRAAGGGAPAGYRWLLRKEAGVAEEQSLQDVLDALAVLAGRAAAGEREARAPVALADVLADALVRARPAAEPQQVRFAVHEPVRDAAVACDAAPLRDAVDALLARAVASVAPGGTLHVALRHDSVGAVLELDAPERAGLAASGLSQAALAARFACVGARFEGPASVDARGAWRVVWPSAVRAEAAP